MKKSSKMPRKISLPGIDDGNPLYLLKGKTYKIINNGREIFGSLRKKISDNSILLVGFDRVMRVVQVFQTTKIFRIDRKRGKHAKK